MNKISRILLLLFTAFHVSACQPGLHSHESIELASSTENSVKVTISIRSDEANNMTLSGTFTPLDPDMHLYSKDIPKTGIDGLGRPALLEIQEDSTIQVIGELIESVHAQLPNFDPKELLVYPAGPVTLTLPIKLLDMNVHSEKVYVTYMACNDQGCRAPVENKAMEINIPKQ